MLEPWTQKKVMKHGKGWKDQAYWQGSTKEKGQDLMKSQQVPKSYQLMSRQ
jgi:hypothetical protein